jgi:hypothetical protein
VECSSKKKRKEKKRELSPASTCNLVCFFLDKVNNSAKQPIKHMELQLEERKLNEVLFQKP